MENKETIIYTSPLTGLVYEAKLNTEHYTRYDITLAGVWKQFALTAEGIATQVRHHEQPGWDGWVASPRD
jgi:hypothetical protein